MSSALDTFLKSKPAPAGGAIVPPVESRNEDIDDENYLSYGSNQNGRQVLTLDVRKLERVRLALPYSYLENIFFDPSGLIEISFTSHTIRIEGQNLEPLYDRLITYSVRYIQQQNPEHEQTSKSGDTFIASIEISKSEK